MNKKIIILPIIASIIVAVVCFCTYEKPENTDKVENIVYENLEEGGEEYPEEELIGRIRIDKINLEAPIKEGSDQEVLKSYVGHIEDTAIYDGNVCLAAHNRGNEYSYFARLNELEKGDEIVYENIYGIKKYRVETSQEILETDWSLLENSSQNKITLITCIANRPNQRLCVQAVEFE